MIKDAGAGYVIIGHSERRRLFGDTDEWVNRKLNARRSPRDLTPIVCIGETLEERDANQTLAVLDRQIDAALAGLTAGPGRRRWSIAYEPVWAIGTGRNATPAQAGEAHAHIRARLRGGFRPGGGGHVPRPLWRERQARQYQGLDGPRGRGRRAGRRGQPECAVVFRDRDRRRDCCIMT